MLNTSRLEHAIRRRKTTRSNLAARIGVHPKAIQRWLDGSCEPTPENYALLAEHLEFPADFFEAPSDLEPVDHTMPSFRARRASRRLLDAASEAAAVAFELERVLVEELRFRLPVRDVPEIEAEPDVAAACVRQRWGLRDRPVRSMVALLETKGVRVFSLPADIVEGKVSAFCVENAAGTPFVLLNTRDASSGERTRFDCAHELGHLVMHRRLGTFGDAAEREADRFAAEFLMPRSSIVACRGIFAPTVTSLARAKTKWGVSVAALARRLRDLEIFSERQYRGICIDLARRGRKNEPNPLRGESSRLIPKIRRALEAEGGLSVLAERVLLHEAELREYLFGLAVMAFDGGGRTSPQRDRPRLELVVG